QLSIAAASYLNGQFFMIGGCPSSLSSLNLKFPGWDGSGWRSVMRYSPSYRIPERGRCTQWPESVRRTLIGVPFAWAVMSSRVSLVGWLDSLALSEYDPVYQSTSPSSL